MWRMPNVESEEQIKNQVSEEFQKNQKKKWKKWKKKLNTDPNSYHLLIKLKIKKL